MEPATLLQMHKVYYLQEALHTKRKDVVSDREQKQDRTQETEISISFITNVHTYVRGMRIIIEIITKRGSSSKS